MLTDSQCSIDYKNTAVCDHGEMSAQHVLRILNRLRRRLMNLVSLRISSCRQAPCREEATCSITAESAALQSADQRGQRPGTGR